MSFNTDVRSSMKRRENIVRLKRETVVNDFVTGEEFFFNTSRSVARSFFFFYEVTRTFVRRSLEKFTSYVNITTLDVLFSSF